MSISRAATEQERFHANESIGTITGEPLPPQSLRVSATYQWNLRSRPFQTGELGRKYSVQMSIVAGKCRSSMDCSIMKL